MSASNDFSKSDGKTNSSEAESDPSQIAQDIEETRDEMSETLDALQQRLEPEQLADQAKDFAHYVILELKAAVQDLAGQAAKSLREAKASSISQPGSSSAAPGNGTQHVTKRVGTQMQAKAGQAQEQAKGIWQSLESSPIAIGALGVALGGIAATMVATSEKENQLTSDGRDRVLGDLQGAAEETIGTVKTAATTPKKSPDRESPSTSVATGDNKLAGKRT